MTNTTKHTYHFDNDDGLAYNDWFHQFSNVLDVRLGTGNLRAGGRFDVHLFGHTVFRDDYYDAHCSEESGESWCDLRGQVLSNNVAAERLYLTLTGPATDLTVGDFYTSIGRGMALTAARSDQLGQDTAIRGLSVALHYNDLDATLLCGKFNFLNIDAEAVMQPRGTRIRSPQRSSPTALLIHCCSAPMVLYCEPACSPKTPMTLTPITKARVPTRLRA